MICKKCNAQNDDAGKFCVICGAPLSSPSPEQIAPQGKKSYMAFIVAILAILLIVTGGSYMLFFRGSAKDYWAPEGTTKVHQYTTGNKSMIYVTIGGKTNFQGKSFNQLTRKEIVLGKEPPESTQYYELSDSSCKYVGSIDSKTGEIILIEPPDEYFRYPLKEGQMWEQRGTRSSSKDNHLSKSQFIINRRVIGSEDVEVPAGKFKAWKIESTVQVDGEITRKVTDWYSKKIGSVKSYVELKDNKYLEIVLVSVSKSGGK
jgi:hypothetical protein